MLALEWLNNVRALQTKIEETQLDTIKEAARLMADSI